MNIIIKSIFLSLVLSAVVCLQDSFARDGEHELSSESPKSYEVRILNAEFHDENLYSLRTSKKHEKADEAHSGDGPVLAVRVPKSDKKGLVEEVRRLRQKRAEALMGGSPASDDATKAYEEWDSLLKKAGLKKAGASPKQSDEVIAMMLMEQEATVNLEVHEEESDGVREEESKAMTPVRSPRVKKFHRRFKQWKFRRKSSTRSAAVLPVEFPEGYQPRGHRGGRRSSAPSLGRGRGNSNAGRVARTTSSAPKISPKPKSKRFSLLRRKKTS